MDREYLSQGYYYPQISISLRNLGRSALDIFHQAEKQVTANILETHHYFYCVSTKLLKIPSLDNLVLKGFSLKKCVGREKMPRPFPAPPIF